MQHTGSLFLNYLSHSLLQAIESLFLFSYEKLCKKDILLQVSVISKVVLTALRTVPCGVGYWQ